MSSLKVKIFAPAGVQLVNVAKSHLTIGSGAHCEIRPAGEGVAAEHFRIWSDGDHLWGQDLGSGYATYMNGQALQPLRPFLFREMDLFRIGESGVSFSCQAVTDGVSRSPEVVTKQPEPPPISDREVRKIEQENEKLSREVLNLRQQLKKATATPEEEEEISEVKRNALQEINAMKEAESRRIDKWKRECVEEVERMVITLMHGRSRSKVSREDARHDVSVALRSVLLGEKIPAVIFQRSESHWKLMAAVVLSAAVCAGYIFRSKLNMHPQAFVTYVSPAGKQDLSSVAPSGTPVAKAKSASDSRGKNKKKAN